VRKSIAGALVAVAGALIVAACGSSPLVPTPPGGGGGGGPVTPPPNNLPVIDSIAIQGTRSKEPANFADLGEGVLVTAKVHDDETAADQLEYQWSATVGTFTGTGASVVWVAPASATTPADVTITLKVVEKYGFPGVPPAFSHDVSGTAALSLHDSVAEVGGMARQFLLDFSDSSIRDVPRIMRNFDMSCGSAAQDEFDQVANNRQVFNIFRWNIGPASVTIPFGNAFCPIPGHRIQRGDACAAVPSHWESTVLSDRSVQIVDGIDFVSAYYHQDSKTWKLCDSQFPVPPATCVDQNGNPCPNTASLAGRFIR
jgi:hypothetical protein